MTATITGITNSNEASAVSTHSVLLTGTIASGKTINIFAGTDGTPTFTPPTGFSTRKSLNANSGLAYFTKVADGTEGGTTVTYGTSASETSSSTSFLLNDDDQASIVISTGASGTSVNPNSDSVTAGSGGDNLFISLFTTSRGDRTISSYPSNYTGNQTDNSNGLGAAGAALGFASRDLTGATDDPGSFTVSDSMNWDAITIVVPPVAAATPVISSPTPSGTLGTDTTATLGATTDVTSGTFFGVVDTAGNISSITAAQIKAGNNNGDTTAIGADSNTVTDTSPTADITGLTANTLFSYAVVHNSTGGDSNVLTGTFTTAVASTAPTLSAPATITDGTSSTWTGTNLDSLEATGEVFLRETAIALNDKLQTYGTPTSTTVPDVVNDTGQDELRDSGSSPISGIAVTADIEAAGATTAVHLKVVDNQSDPEDTDPVVITTESTIQTVQTMIAVAETDSGEGLFATNIVTVEDDHQCAIPKIVNSVTLTLNANGDGSITVLESELDAAGGSITFDALYYSPSTEQWAKVSVTLSESGIVVTNGTGLTSALTSSLTGPLTFALTGAPVGPTTRFFITLDAALNGNYVVSSAWTATTDYTITADISTIATSGVLVSSFTDVNNNYAILLTAGGFIEYVSEVGGVTTTKTGTGAVNDGKLQPISVSLAGTTLTIIAGGVTDVFTSTPTDSAIVDNFGSQNGANFFDGVLANVKLADDTASSNTFTFALDNETSNTETAVEGGNSVTYTNIPTGVPDRESFTLVGDDWIGQELITDGDMSNPSSWTAGTGWEITGGEAVGTATTANLDQSGLVFNSGQSFQTVFSVLDFTSGEVRIRLTGAANNSGTVRSANGTFTEVITSTADNSILRFPPPSAFTGSVDDVSTKRILEAP